MPMIEAPTATGPRMFHAHFYKGWALTGPGKTTVTHPSSGYAIIALDSRQEARRLIDLLALEGVDPASTPEELVNNERLKLVRGYALTHDLITDTWNGYLNGRPQPGSPWYRRRQTRRERQRSTRLRRKRRQRSRRA